MDPGGQHALTQEPLRDGIPSGTPLCRWGILWNIGNRACRVLRSHDQQVGRHEQHEQVPDEPRRGHVQRSHLRHWRK